MVLQVFCFFLLLLSLLICFYYWFLVIITLFTREQDDAAGREVVDHLSFAIVVPAYNEEDVIARTLLSCNNLNYPSENFEVYVVADNCTDKTADIARTYDSTVLERFDVTNRGKGSALVWAFKRILRENFDAIIVVDADCLLDPKALMEIAVCVDKGHSVIQINNRVENSDDSPMSYALAVGNFIENELFYTPKSSLGLAVIVRGTGMVFTKDVLLRYPWEAHSIVEDLEYSLILIKAGLKIKFLRKVKVISPFPTSLEQLRIQRTRWASGNLGFGKTEAFKLIWKGLAKWNIALADAGWSFLVLSKPLVLIELFLTVFTALGCVFFVPGRFSVFLLTSSLVLTGLYIAYFMVGICKFGLSWHRFSFLMQTPIVVVHLMFVSLLGIIGVKKDLWVRTPRK